MKLKEIIYYYPSFEKGGVEKILLNLIKYSKNLKIRMTIITSKKIMKTDTNLSILIVKKKNHHGTGRPWSSMVFMVGFLLGQSSAVPDFAAKLFFH